MISRNRLTYMNKILPGTHPCEAGRNSAENPLYSGHDEDRSYNARSIIKFVSPKFRNKIIIE